MARYNKKNNRGRFFNGDQNVGIPGVVYILDNPALSNNIYKIGCTKHSGKKRANDLNNEAKTGMPASFVCIYEYHTKDCGTAEKRVFDRLKEFRYKTQKTYDNGQGQEYFSLPDNLLDNAKLVIKEVCQEIDYHLQQEILRKQTAARIKIEEEKARLKMEEEAKAKLEENLKAEAKARQDERKETETVAIEKAREIITEAKTKTANNFAKVDNANESHTINRTSQLTFDQNKNDEKKTSVTWWVIAGIVFLLIINNSEKNTKNTETNTKDKTIKETIVTGSKNNGANNSEWQNLHNFASPQSEKTKENKYVRVVSDCLEQIAISFVFENNSNLISQGWWDINPASHVNTNIRSDSNKIYFYAYSKKRVWHGDDVTGVKRHIVLSKFSYNGDLISFDNTQKSLDVYFKKSIMSELDDHFELRLSCDSKDNDNKIKKPIGTNKHKINTTNIAHKQPGGSSEIIDQAIDDKEIEIEKLNKEARRLAKIADELQRNRIEEERLFNKNNKEPNKFKEDTILVDEKTERELKMKNKVRNALEEEKKKNEYLEMMKRISNRN